MPATKTILSEINHEVVLGYLTLIGGLFSFFYGLYTYEKVKSDEAAKAYWSARFPIYQDLCRTAATVATTNDTTEFEKAKQHFWQLYFGEARLVVEGNDLAMPMSKFGGLLNQYEKHTIDKNDLRFGAYELSVRCRTYLLKSWGRNIDSVSTSPM